MKMTFSARGSRIVRQGLQDTQALPPKLGRLFFFRTMQKIVRIMRPYPAERPGQTYRRTGRLRRGWKIVRLGNTGYKIENRARFKGQSYLRWVVGDAYGNRQAWMHVGRWKVFRDVVDDEFEKIPPDIATEIHRVARRNGWGSGAVV
jgi:hypothetical protein